MARTAKRYMTVESEQAARERARFSVGIYSRLSVDHHDRKSESIENQIDIIKDYISENNANPDREMDFVIYDTYIDRGISGTSFERNGFERLMQDVRKRNVNCIIVKDLSRFGRDYLETGNLIEKILPFLGCRFISVADNFDSMVDHVNENKLAMNIKNLVNDMYAKDISKRVTLARKMSAESGSFIGSFAPYGYEVVTIEGIRKLQLNEECARIVRYIFDLYAEGSRIKDIITRLYEDKVHRISDYKKYGHVYCEDGEILNQWSESSISGILGNTNYLGNLQQCKSQSRLYEGRKGISYAEEKDLVTVNHTHQPIVSEELFERVQARKNEEKSDPKVLREMKDTENIYRNILYCGCCGRVMHATYYQSRGKDERNYAYHCRGAYRIDGRKCEKNYIREEQITAFVLEQLRKSLKAQQVKAKDLTKLNMTEYEDKIEKYALEEMKILEESENMKKQAGILYGQYKEGVITKEEYSVFKQNKKEHENYAAKRLDEIRRKVKKAKCRAEEENKFLRSLFKADKCKKLNIQLVESLVEKILVFPDGVIDITYKFSDGGMVG